MTHQVSHLEAVQLVVCQQERVILQDVSFAAMPGELHVILGPNGAGKSTLVRALAGLQVLNEGKVLCAGKSVDQLSAGERAIQLAVLLQEQWLDFPFCVQDVISMGSYPLLSALTDGEFHAGCTIDQALETFDLAALRYQDYTRLSGGEQQRVHLARLLMQVNTDTKALVLDEPLKAIDLSHQYVVMNQLKKLAYRGFAVVVVLHDLSLAARFADRITLLKKGKVVRTGKTAEVMQCGLLSDVFEANIEKSKDAEAPLFYVSGSS